jgi:hypothetical protein
MVLGSFDLPQEPLCCQEVQLGEPLKDLVLFSVH